MKFLKQQTKTYREDAKQVCHVPIKTQVLQMICQSLSSRAWHLKPGIAHHVTPVPGMQVSDNMRYLNVHQKTGEPFLLPAEAIRRVVLCTGQIYYALSNARRAKRVRDVVFVRLEQIAPFPHDILVRVSRSEHLAPYIAMTKAEFKWLSIAPAASHICLLHSLRRALSCLWNLVEACILAKSSMSYRMCHCLPGLSCPPKLTHAHLGQHQRGDEGQRL